MATPMSMDALVLAGGALEMERFHGLPGDFRRKAEIPILGRPMVEWTVDGLRSCPDVERIAVVGHPDLHTSGLHALDVVLVPEAGSIAENLRAGLEALAGARRVLVVSGDLPLVDRTAVEDLFRHAPKVDVVFPYAERQDVLRIFPEREWIFANTPEGAFTGSGVALLRPDVVLRQWEWVEQLLDARRLSPVRLALMIGPAFAVKYLFRRLRVADVERKVSALLRLEGRGYRSPYPELAMDVDKLSDVALAETILQQRLAQSRPDDYRPA